MGEGQRSNKTLSFSLSLHLSICSHAVFLFPFFALEGKKSLSEDWRSIYCEPMLPNSNTLSLSVSGADLLASLESLFYTSWGWKSTGVMMKLNLALHNGIRILTSLLFQCLNFNYSMILEEFLITYFNAVKEGGFVCRNVRIQ